MWNNSHPTFADVSGEVQVLQGRVCKTLRFLKLDPTCLIELRKHHSVLQNCCHGTAVFCLLSLLCQASLCCFVDFLLVNQCPGHFCIQCVSSMHLLSQSSMIPARHILRSAASSINNVIYCIIHFVRRLYPDRYVHVQNVVRGELV